MVRVFGVVKVNRADVVSIDGKRYGELHCTDRDGNTMKLYVPVAKHANFLNGKWITFEGKLDGDMFVAELNSIFSLDFKPNGNSVKNGAYRPTRQEQHTKHEVAVSQQNNEEEIPF